MRMRANDGLVSLTIQCKKIKTYQSHPRRHRQDQVVRFPALDHNSAVLSSTQA